MSGSETGVMTSREPFLQASPLQSQSQAAIQTMRLDYTSGTNAIYKPVTSASPPPYQSAAGAGAAVAAPAAGDGSTGGGGGGGVVMPSGLNMNMGAEPMKRKRGRPRKYGPDGTMALALSPSAPSVPVSTQSSGGFSPPPPPPASGGAASPTSTKKPRGRPPGSTKKHQLEALGNGLCKPFESYWVCLISVFNYIVFECLRRWVLKLLKSTML